MKLFLTKSAYKSLEKLHDTNKKDSKIIKEAIDNIKDNPYDSKRMKGKFKAFNRVKRGEYRIIFHIDKKEKIISVVEIGKRSNIYK
ncbi:MAG: type II toxin-antitoxin system RelE/ParE family toxin [Methanobrevibacter sp.]|nr:type II toxin-antitoxin system RelE/ParE family toxin [Methanobrevibacter sp.]